MEDLKTAAALTINLFLVSNAAGLIAAEGHNPKNAAQDSDLVIHGTVSNIAESGEVTEHHPIQINVTETFKGNTSDTVKVQVKGTERMSVSTAAQFTEGEEVVVMLEDKEDRFYMTTGYATKYEVNNDTIQLVAPEHKNITLTEMEEIVENTALSTTNNSPEMEGGGSSTESGFSIIKPVTAVLEAAMNRVI